MAAALAAGGCDGSKADLEKARNDQASMTRERDGLKTQLDQATAREASLAGRVAERNAKLAATEQPKRAGAVNSTEHSQATSQKMEEKPGKKATQARKKG